MPIVEETTLDAEATLGKNKGADTQEPTEEADVTQEPAVEMEQPHGLEVGTPIFDEDIESRRTLNPNSGGNYEKLLLIYELQKWKQEAISLWDGMILLKEHQREIDTLHERWMEVELKKNWEDYKKKEALKKQEEQLLLLQDQIRDLTIDKQKLHDLALNLLGCRRPSPSYPIFLWERYFLFQLKAIM